MWRCSFSALLPRRLFARMRSLIDCRMLYENRNV